MIATQHEDPKIQRENEVAALKERNAEERRKAAEVSAQRVARAAYLKRTPLETVRSELCAALNGIAPMESFRAVMSDTTNEAGGYLVPTELLDVFVQEAGEYGIARAHCRIVPLNTRDASVPLVTRGLTIFNLASYRQTEVALDDFLVGNANIVTRPFSVVATATAELIDSGRDWAEKTLEMIAIGFDQIRDRLVFKTTGHDYVAPASGLSEILVTPGRAGSLVTLAGGSTTLASVTAGKLREVCGKVPARAAANARWFMHPKVMADVMLRLTTSAHATGDADETFPMFVDGGVTYFGPYPVVPTAAMPSAPAAGEVALLLGDLRKAVSLGQREAEEIATSTLGEVFLRSEALVRGTLRTGVGFTDIGDESNAGSIIGLQLAAS